MEHSLRKQPAISPVSDSHHDLEKDETEFKKPIEEPDRVLNPKGT